jgi:hypothetical protein
MEIIEQTYRPVMLLNMDMNDTPAMASPVKYRRMSSASVLDLI